MGREAVSFECATCGETRRGRLRPDGRVKCPECSTIQTLEMEDEEPERPRRRRKKRKPASSRLPLVIAGSILGVVSLGVVVIGAVALSRSRPAVAIETREHSNTVFSVRHPSDWKVDSGGLPHFAWVTLSKGSASIKIRIHAADALGNAMGIVQTDPKLAARQFHMDRKSTYEEEFGSGYEEDEEPTAIDAEAGTGYRSSFKAKAMFGSLRGVRATILGIAQINATARCSAGDWKTYEPEFDRIIRSIGFPKVEPGAAGMGDDE